MDISVIDISITPFLIDSEQFYCNKELIIFRKKEAPKGRKNLTFGAFILNYLNSIQRHILSVLF